ncbi:MAG: response regulator [Leptolyngbyaceae cyanobacterium MAG.088]|nr:response regulator [Leptolyngbyaceae cyanobacterium MAG.088]
MIKLLLVDSNAHSCQTLAQGLKVQGYDVVTALRGDQALQLTNAESPNLILLNMTRELPVVSGWQMVGILKKTRELRSIPVVAIVDRDLSGHRLKQAGFNTYVRKPESFRHLLLRINNLLGRVFSCQLKGGGTNVKSASYTSTLMAKKIAQSQQQLEKPTVVHVEDSPADSQKMARIVHKAGFHHVVLSDSLQALPRLLEIKPQLIFLDLVMPIVSGYELCAQLRRISAFQQTPIFIVTNNNGIADRLRARITGASGFIAKPITEQYVLQALQTVQVPVAKNLVNA